MYQSLYRRFRPQSFTEIVGQAHVLRVLQAAITKNRVAHAYFFTGPRGTGKTTVARLLAKAVNCEGRESGEKKSEPVFICGKCSNCVNITEGRSLDVVEIDAASNNGVEDVRALRERIQFPPQDLKKKVYIIDEVHMLSTGAFNALLKTLEEPPAHAMFILATTEPHKVPITIQSRCQRLDFHRASQQDLIKHLATVVGQEKVKIDQEALELVAELAEGSFRDSLTLLERLLQEGGAVNAERARELLGLGSDEVVRKIVEAMLDKKRAATFELLDEAAARGVHPPYLARSVTDIIRRLMYLSLKVVKSGRDWDNAQIAKTNLQGWRRLLQYWQTAIIDSREAPIAMLPLEIAAAFWLEEDSTQPKKVEEEQPAETKPELEQQPVAAEEVKPAMAEEVEPVIAEAAEAVLDGPIQPEQWQQVLSELISFNHSLTKLLQQAAVGHIQAGKVPVYVQYQFHADTLKKQSNTDALAKALAKATKARLVPEFLVGPAPADAIRVQLVDQTNQTAPTQASQEPASQAVTDQTDNLIKEVEEVFK